MSETSTYLLHLTYVTSLPLILSQIVMMVSQSGSRFSLLVALSGRSERMEKRWHQLEIQVKVSHTTTKNFVITPRTHKLANRRHSDGSTEEREASAAGRGKPTNKESYRAAVLMTERISFLLFGEASRLSVCAVGKRHRFFRRLLSSVLTL